MGGILTAPFFLMKSCIDCGNDYDYDPNNPKGSSSERCAACRKRDSARNKKIILLNIAGHHNPICRMCGYSKTGGLTLIDAIPCLSPPTTQQEKEAQALRQFVLCLNCKSQLDAREIQFKVINSKPPMEIEFYSRHVRIVEEKITPTVNYSHDVIETEITREEPEGDRVGRKKTIPRIGTVIDVPS